MILAVTATIYPPGIGSGILRSDLVFPAVFVAILLFFGILLSLKIGKLIASRNVENDSETISFGAIDGAVFSFLSLFLAFSLSAAGSRLETRREIVVTEATSIREAYLYAESIPKPIAGALTQEIKDYVRIRQAYNHALSNYMGNEADLDAEYDKTLAAQNSLWKHSIDLLAQPKSHEDIHRLQSALVATFRAGADRHVAALTREPDLIYGLLIAVALLAGVLAGRQLSNSRKNQLMHRIIFALVISSTLYVMMDLDNPRRGLIKLEYADQLLRDI